MSSKEEKMKIFLKKRPFLTATLAAVILIGLAILIGWLIKGDQPSAKTNIPEPKKYQAQPPVQDHILVKFKNKVSDAKKNEIHQKTGGKVKEEIKQIGVQIVNIPKG